MAIFVQGRSRHLFVVFFLLLCIIIRHRHFHSFASKTNQIYLVASRDVNRSI